MLMGQISPERLLTHADCLREAIKKKLRNFGHCPKRGGRVGTAAKLFIDEKYERKKRKFISTQ